MLGDELRHAVEGSGLTLYRIAKASGVTYPVLHRFVVHKRDIKLSSVERLADLFSMRLTQPRKPTRKEPES